MESANSFSKNAQFESLKLLRKWTGVKRMDKIHTKKSICNECADQVMKCLRVLRSLEARSLREGFGDVTST